MGFILDLLGDFISQWLVTVKNRPFELLSLLVVFFGLAYLSIGMLITPDANHVAGSVIGIVALVLLWLGGRALWRSKDNGA